MSHREDYTSLVEALKDLIMNPPEPLLDYLSKFNETDQAMWETHLKFIELMGKSIPYLNQKDFEDVSRDVGRFGRALRGRLFQSTDLDAENDDFGDFNLNLTYLSNKLNLCGKMHLSFSLSFHLTFLRVQA